MPNYQFRATFRFTFSFGARFHRRIDGRPPQFDTRCKRFQNRFLFSVVGRRSFVSVTRKYLSVSRYNHCTYTIGRGRGRTFAAFVDRHLQVAAVFGGPVGLDRIGRDPHSSQRFGRMRRLQITGTDLQTGCPGIPHFTAGLTASRKVSTRFSAKNIRSVAAPPSTSRERSPRFRVR